MLGVIGGTGLYSLLEKAEEQKVETPYGPTSSPVQIGKISGRRVAFIARHGTKHQYPPHKVPYKANIWALKELGVKRIIAPAAVGSLKPEIKPGDFLVPDQFVNFTRRDDTFYDGPETVHVSSAEPYCPTLRKILIETMEGVHEKGTVVVVQGPRFSTKSESDFFQKQGWDVINMTQYPECMLAREQEICYAGLCIITDYDTGLKSDPNVKPVTLEEVVKTFNRNVERLKTILQDVIPKIPEKRECVCAKALEGAKL
jgi:5'-methylthioadenosine phosphorylase